MRIRVERLRFQGVGPFRNEETFDLPAEGTTYVYAPNGHGKTSTIDLVRWLIRGQAAIENNEFRSLKQTAEKDVINHHRFRNMEGGEAEAILTVEDDGRYRVRRTIEWSTSPSSELTVARDENGAWEPVDEPRESLSDLFPHERLGFNLLTGEHIKDFVEELSGPIVKRSVERMLQNPELITLQGTLEDIHEDMQKLVRAEDRTERRRTKLKDKKADLQDREKSFQRRVKDKKAEEHAIQEEIEELNQELAKLDDAEDLETERDRLKTAISELNERQQRETDAFADEISPAWRTILATAVQEPATKCLAEHTAKLEEHEQWEEDIGEVRYLERLLDADTCYCGTEMDDEHRAKIQARIDQLETGEPDVPELPVDEWTLRSWAEGGAVDELVDDLDPHARRLAEIASDLAEKENELADVRDLLQEADGDRADMLDRRIRARKRKLNAIQDEKSQLVRRQLDAQERLNDVKSKLADTQSEHVPGRLVRNARDYNNAIRETIDNALPKLRQDLLDRTQAIFDKLFQKDAQFRIALSGSSMVPHVVRDVDGEEETVPLSEGEQTRLGLALLFALRDVAQEQPFLLLDAPFSTLDDDGVHQLLELIADHDGQLVVFTKDAFPPGRFYDAVKMAKPTVYQMDWITDGPSDREGLTEIKPAKTDVLRLEAR